MTTCQEVALSANTVAIGDMNGEGEPDLVTVNGETPSPGKPYTVSILLNATGRCGVPDVRGATLSNARHAIARASCRVGAVRHAYSKTVREGLVISQSPRSGTLLRTGSKVNLVVSRGRKH